jgi:Putative addiction module component
VAQRFGAPAYEQHDPQQLRPPLALVARSLAATARRNLPTSAVRSPTMGLRARLPDVATMTAFEALLDQALKLPDDERSKLAARLLRSLEPDDSDEPSAEEWDGAWSAELGKRLREIREGTVDLVDGDDVLAELREIFERP